MRVEDQDDFESDEMKLDVDDRVARRERSKPQKSASVSRQHIKIGIGILVLLLLIFLVSSALKAPSPQNNGPREVNLGTNSGSGTPQQTTDTPPVNNPPQEITPPPISGTPTESQPLSGSPNQQRVEIPGEITDALTAQQEQLNRLKETEMPGSGTPTTVAGQQPTGTAPVKKPAQYSQPAASSPRSTTQSKPVSQPTTTPKPTSTPKPATPKVSEAPTAPVAKSSTTAGTVSGLSAIPANRVTLQVSSASRSDSLLAFAKKNNMTDYWVYSTLRDGKPWFVLVTGNYASATEARSALSGMPQEVQANKPWVRSMQQVHQDLKQK
ncbi:SPOR domain-containing protein [Limnobaculum parvum]|uniref:SPOR domain-containing protein n=1 Tax=Limnobaculum parvum TaxID=2172103 RepID=A0A2Y9TYV9_9GAMM|nr:SPOR domain-containing protein [Limnobaculum parvum]AWH88564.1 SPOR domain-containing protein [Limnobaculum parvum]